MKFSESWLREWINPSVTTDQLSAQLTMAGLEVDSVAPVAGSFQGVVVGEVLAVERHPDADKLSVCQVAGAPEGPLQVVCGAPNVRAGLKAPFALIGASLGNDFKIKRAKLRGVESSGMLCSAEELGVEHDGDGLWELPGEAPVGENLRDYLQLDDRVIEVDLTPNRGDCLGILGLAREVAVLNGLELSPHTIKPIAPAIDERVGVTLQAPQGCPRYLGRVIRNIEPSAVTPLWMTEKLRRSGVRPLHPVVDVTNYVLLELGQPMHAFDLERIDGEIVVRLAREGEPLRLLGGNEPHLRQDTLVVADRSQALAMAGVMGGEQSAVGDATRHIFLESAYFAPLAIAGKARSYGLHTDSSHRFERGVDPDLCLRAMERATELLLDIVGGDAGPVVRQEHEGGLPSPSEVFLNRSRLDQQLGFALEEAEVRSMLTRLGLELLSCDDNGWHWRIPSWRFDIAIQQDLIEELARIRGYDNLPVAVPSGRLELSPRPESVQPLSRLRDVLVGLGYQEAITYSFVDPKLQSLFDSTSEVIPLANPISADMSVMRTSLWPGLVSALLHNVKRQQSRAKFFEVGLRFFRQDNEIKQEKMISGLVYGPRHPEGWAAEEEEVDFFDLKGDVEVLLGLGGKLVAYHFSPAHHEALHPGQTALLSVVNTAGEVNNVGVIGRLHPRVQQELSLQRPVYLFEMSLSAALDAHLPSFKELSRYPEVRRDLAFVVDQAISASELLEFIRANAGPALAHLKIFDVYQGKGVENNKKSLAFGLTFQDPSRTLTESDINEAVNTVVAQLKRQFAADLRG